MPTSLQPAVLALLLCARGSGALSCWPGASLGCFDDAAGPHVVSAATDAGDPSQLSGSACATACAAQGYPLLGLTGHTSPSVQAFCYCGSAPDPAAVRAKSPQSCSLACPGNASETCGGNYFMSAYAASCDGPIPVPLANGTACSQPETRGLPFCDTSLPLGERADDLVARLTLEEIGAQLTARNSPPIPRLGIPAYYWGVNAIHGITNAVSEGGVLCLNSTGRCVTIWPSGPGLGATWNASMWRQVGATTGVEMRALGNVQWGPVARPGVGMDGLTAWGPTINLVRDPRWGRVQETASEDPYLNGVFATQLTRGMQEGEDSRFLLAGATLKHFAVYSLEDYRAPNGSHYTRENINSIYLDAWELADTYFPHFRAAVSPVSAGGGGAAGVMMAMNELNGVPCLASAFLIDTLRNWSGVDALYITTDGINMIDSMIAAEPGGHGFCPYHAAPCSRAEGVAAAALAGSDICDGSEYQAALADAVSAGLLPLAAARARLRASLLIRMRLGLFDPYADQPYTRYGAERVGAPASVAASLQAAGESLVLLANPGGALPFASLAGTTVVVGFAANDTQRLISNYVSQVCPDRTARCWPSLAQALAAAGAAVVVAPGCSSATACAPADIAAAAAAVAAPGVARVVLTLGLDQSLEAEQRDRQNLTLPPAQLALLAAVLAAAPLAVPLAAVLLHGGAVALPELKASRAAILDCFYPGPLGGTAIAQALTGELNPGGKLPYTVYDAAYEAVDFVDMRVAALGRTYRYRTAASPGGAPLWPFGYGLSYTNFTAALTGAPPALALTPAAPAAALTVRLTNSGARDGDEVLQLYFVPAAGTLAPPAPPFLPTRQLAGFQRVRLAAGAQTDVSLSVDARLMLLTTPAGVRKPIDGQYSIVVARGTGEEEIVLPASLAGF